MLEHLNHPFLCNLRYSFQDIEYLYLSPSIGNQDWLITDTHASATLSST